MRRPNRQIDIFSISALDLFASALGAFILVSIILFPYYLKDRKADEGLAVEKQARQAAESKVADESAALAALKSENERQALHVAALETDVAHYQALESKPFLIVGVRWTVPGADIDLHVTDPAGHEFYWFKNNDHGRDYPDSTAELSYDMTSGPAIELWQDPTAVAGRYKIEYVANALPSGYQVEVHGNVFDRGGKRDLPVKILATPGARVTAATLIVNADGGSVAIE